MTLSWRAPLDPFIEMPGGSPLADQVYGSCPPVACKVRMYGVPTVLFGRLVVVIVGAEAFGAIVTLSARVAVFPPLVTWTEKLAVCAVVGIPLNPRSGPRRDPSV